MVTYIRLSLELSFQIDACSLTWLAMIKTPIAAMKTPIGTTVALVNPQDVDTKGYIQCELLLDIERMDANEARRLRLLLLVERPNLGA